MEMILRIREAVQNQSYVLTEHAVDEMNEDRLDVLDVEAAILTGSVVNTLSDDPRGIRYVVQGTACDLSTYVEVVVRWVQVDALLVLTVYQVGKG